jgi:hypothetical protein
MNLENLHRFTARLAEALTGLGLEGVWKATAYEQALTKQGVPFRYLERVPWGDAKGLANQARLDEQLVEQSAASFQDGADFTPLVLDRPGWGRYVPLDGNQRLAGVRKYGVTAELREVLERNQVKVTPALSAEALHEMSVLQTRGGTIQLRVPLPRKRLARALREVAGDVTTSSSPFTA